MKKNINDLDIVDSEELLEKIETEATSIEANLIKLYSEQPEEAGRVPVFDFELN